MPPRHARLVICVRCHQYPEFVLDEVDSILHYSVTSPHIMLGVDRGPHNDPAQQHEIADVVTKAYPQVGVFKADRQWGWGAGMYGLLCDSIKWAEQHYAYDHFLSIDYDALFIRKGADAALLKSAEEPNAGLVGTHNMLGKTWAKLFKNHWLRIMEMTHNKRPPGNWEKDCVYGAVMLLTRPCLLEMTKRGYFDDPFRSVKDNVKISDDPWTVFLVRLAGFRVIDNRRYCYNVWKSPEDYKVLVPKRPELKIFHPIKMNAGGRPTNYAAEAKNRNYFRRQRSKPPLEVKK